MLVSFLKLPLVLPPVVMLPFNSEWEKSVDSSECIQFSRMLLSVVKNLEGFELMMVYFVVHLFQLVQSGSRSGVMSSGRTFLLNLL